MGQGTYRGYCSYSALRSRLMLARANLNGDRFVILNKRARDRRVQYTQYFRFVTSMIEDFRQKKWVEWVALSLAGLGFVLILNPLNFSALAQRASDGAIQWGLTFARRLSDFHLSHWLGLGLLLVAAGLMVQRLRYRLRTSERLVDRKCPRCGRSLQRVHRHVIDRAIARFVPVYRYRCRNRSCGWSGLRVRRLKQPRR